MTTSADIASRMPGGVESGGIDDAESAPKPEPSVAKTLGIDGYGRLRSWIKRAVWLAVLVFVLVGAWRVWTTSRIPEPVVYATEPVERGDLVLTVSATGTLQPRNVVEVGPEISGRVLEVLVDYNDRVVAGQTLARLDPELLEAALEEARAQEAVARARRSEAQATLDEVQSQAGRVRYLIERGARPQEELEAIEAQVLRAEAGVETAEASVRAARAARRRAQSGLDKVDVVSPIDGIVLERSVEEGQAVVAELQAVVLFLIAEDLSEMRLHVDVDEADIGSVHEGQSATFTVAAFLDREYHATLVSVRNAPRIRSDVVTYEAVLAVENDDLSLRPNMTASAEIVVDVQADRLLVPNAALRFQPHETAGVEVPEGSSTVWILDDGRPVVVPIEVGDSDGLLTVVDSGELSPGLEVIVEATGGPSS